MTICLRNIEEEKMKIEAIYTQLQFHSIVLTLCAPKQFYFQKSHTEKGRKIDFTSNQMQSHLEEIIKLNITETEVAADSNVQELVQESENQKQQTFRVTSEEERSEEILKQKKTLMEKLKDNGLKRQSKESKTLLDELQENPGKLVGNRIKHKVRKTAEDLPEWFDASVSRIDGPSKNTLKTSYKLTYDIDGEHKKYSVPLLTELKKGNLVVMD